MVSPKLLGKRLLDRMRANGIEVDALFLFGSHARGEARADSDIDVLLVSPTFERKGLWSRCGQVGRALSGLPEPVQIYPVNRAEFEHPMPGGFIEAIRPDLKPLYKRRRRRATRGRSRLSGARSR